jgi:hypothetical protein
MKYRFSKPNLAPIIFLIVFVCIVSLPIVSLADSHPDESVSIDNPINATSINGLIKTILTGVIKIGIPIVAIALVYSGFLFVSARGRPKELTEAKDALLYTLIGAGILLGSWAIAQLISDTVLQL